MENAEAVRDNIEQEFVKRVIESMPRRVNAIINAKGWYTQY